MGVPHEDLAGDVHLRAAVGREPPIPSLQGKKPESRRSPADRKEGRLLSPHREQREAREVEQQRSPSFFARAAERGSDQMLRNHRQRL